MKYYLYHIIAKIFVLVGFRNGHQEKETNQNKNEHHIEVQHHIETQHHVADENDGHNHTHPKLDIKNFHTQLW